MAKQKLGLPGISLITSGLQTAGGLIGQIIGNRARRKAADTAWSRNLEQWHRQNRYNDPSQQMARFKAAGLNPNMIYGSSQPAGLASSAPSAPVPNIENVDPGQTPVISQYQSIRNAQQTERLVRQKLKTEMEVTMLKALEAEGKTLTNQEQEIKNLILDGWGMNMKSAEYQALISGTKVKDAQAKKLDQEVQNLKTLDRYNQFRSKIEGKNWDWFDKTGVRPHDPLWAKMLTQVITKFMNQVEARGKVTMDDIRKEFSQAEIEKLTPAEKKILQDLIDAQD